MLVIELTYKTPLEKVDQFVQAHRAFLQRYYDEGLFLVSGPQEPRTGGIIIALADKSRLKAIIKNDPFYQEGIADYRFIEFKPVKYHSELSGLLKQG
ncbi:MAG: hypothetical protein K0R12_284 [Gammaproteobacteria bacterium]|jgi:uncharacterized protein YciI|nr:hypothetical protein [Gammaproteobacteria bacterium]